MSLSKNISKKIFIVFLSLGIYSSTKIQATLPYETAAKILNSIPGAAGIKLLSPQKSILKGVALSIFLGLCLSVDAHTLQEIVKGIYQIGTKIAELGIDLTTLTNVSYESVARILNFVPLIAGVHLLSPQKSILKGTALSIFLGLCLSAGNIAKGS